eukprot:11193339-Alexandrium_andersonii.AAC.1
MRGARYWWEAATGPALLSPQAPQAPYAAPSSAQPSEVRRKAKDSAHYTWEQFVQYYGPGRASAEWSRAPVFHPEPSTAQPASSSSSEPPPGLSPAVGHTDAPQPGDRMLQD